MEYSSEHQRARALLIQCVCVYVPIKAILHQPRTLPLARYVILSWVEPFPYGQREGSAHLYDDFHHLSESLRRSRDYAGVIRVQHAPHRTTNVVHGWLRSHRRRRFLQVHQLGEDGRFLTESLENNSQYGCEEDVEQQRGQHASLP